MKLKEYFYQKKAQDLSFTLSKLAKEIDTDNSTISRIMHGKQIISFKLALKIEKATEGMVSAWDLVHQSFLLYKKRHENN